MEKKLVIFDGNALLHRAYHAIPLLNTKKQEPINALYGLVSMLITVVDNLKPTDIVFCFDEKEKTFRSEILSTYQSQRPKTPDELSSQFEKARVFLKSAKIPVYSKSGFEADDLIATLATKIKSMDKVVVVTGDRDILQIVDDSRNIKLFMPIAGLSNGKLFGEKETFERMGVLPFQIPDYKALVGDPSDNYFGIPGIGPKTAANLIQKFISLKGIYKNIDQIAEKLAIKLKENKDLAEMSYKLALIVKDVPFDFDSKEFNKWDIGSKEVVELFETFGFKTLTDRIKRLSEKLKQERQQQLFI